MAVSHREACIFPMRSAFCLLKLDSFSDTWQIWQCIGEKTCLLVNHMLGEQEKNMGNVWVSL